MTAILVPCSSCGRHVFGHDATCPFCGSRARVRSALVVAAALGVGALAGCDPSPGDVYGPAPPRASTRSVTSTLAAVYGPAPMPSETRSATTSSGASASATAAEPPPVPVYGPPPPAASGR
ncbi:MAG: hypothetical protein IT373_29530 [Polyangiaceae bacterium]|nr:hypothetical protein [Polyangiaceae bacterium]